MKNRIAWNMLKSRFLNVWLPAAGFVLVYLLSSR